MSPLQQVLDLRPFYDAVWVHDFEFHQPPGSRPVPLCVGALEIVSGRRWTAWLDGASPIPSPWHPTPVPQTCWVQPPWQTTARTLFVGYYASAEFSCFRQLQWPLPVRAMDLFVEFRNHSNGLALPCGRSLLGALRAHGLQGMASSIKEDMRSVAMRGGPFTPQEQQDLLQYCLSDVDATARLFEAMLPTLDVPRSLLRGRYTLAISQVELTGTPIDHDTFGTLCTHWETLKRKLVETVNREYGVFVPADLSLDPTTRFGAAILHAADAWGLDPYALAAAADHLWRAGRELYLETRTARLQARQRTGLTIAQIARWERSGRDSSTWPGLDDVAQELTGELPALGLGVLDEDDSPDVSARLWDLLREADAPAPQRHDRAILRQAAALIREDPDGWVGWSPVRFSAERFARYLARHQIPWPRLPRGALALDDDTFKEMARAFPAQIGPLRELRHLLSQLKLRDLALGADGRNRCLLSIFASTTGRNQPSTSQFVFGPSCWLRSLIKPGPGYALAYCDWSQQELAIAARLSGDEAMQEAYRSGDFYLSFAKMAGVAPQDATKESHPTVREQFKIVALGVLYGLSAQGIARRLSVPVCQGRQLLHYHHTLFRQFWRWSDTVEVQGMLGGSLRTCFGWRMYTTRATTGRSLRNYPMQSHGSEMLRLAICLAVERGICVCAPIHDAVLIEAPLQDIESAVARTQAVMAEASTLVLPGFALRTDAQIVRYPDRYVDPRGVGMWEKVHAILEEVTEATPF